MKKTTSIISLIALLSIIATTAIQAQIDALPLDTSDHTGSIGPGRVSLSLTPTGQWTALRTTWDGDESLIKDGGIVVYMVGEDGELIELANTGRRGMQMSSHVRFRRSFEGAAGGVRAPSARPDDDGDGRVDEDRLDGIDNDGDGRVDEDFAAIGDEMMVCGIRTAAGTDHPIALHQELYAWSLPHIDGAIMLSVRIRNAGEVDVDALRIAVYYVRDGALTVRRQHPGTGATVSYENESTRLTLVPFAKGGEMWSDGVVSAGEDAFQLMRQAVRPREEFDMPADLQILMDGALVYSMSPVLGPLAPGEETRIDVGLIAVPATVSPDDATDRAIKTFAGHDGNAYLPPPVAMKPRLLWGGYKPLPNRGGVWLNFNVLGQAPITADDFSFFSGAAAKEINRYEIKPGEVVLTLSNDVVDEWTRDNDRITLKGRLKSGEFFEATLRPQYETEMPPVAKEEAERFWTTSGRLTQQLLKASPNPFRETTQIAYEIPLSIEQEDGTVLQFSGSYDTAVRIYNVTGRLINTLDERITGPGLYTLDWAGVDDAGSAVASGVYYVKLQIENRFITKRLILVK